MTGGRVKGMINDALERLARQLDAGMSHELKRYLAAMARFHRYSAGNLLLILSQQPDASRVAGYQTWKRLNRQVKRGEKGILILAPIVRRERDHKNGPANQDEDTVVAFKTTYVFDVEQTDGKELPEPNRVKGDPEEYLDRLEDFIQEHNIDVEYTEQLRGVDGVSSGGQVTILASLSPAEQFSTLVHELSHELLHWKNGKSNKTVVRETEAEAVAFIVCQAIGLDTGQSSSDYIQLYSGTTNTLLDSLQRIQRTAREIIDGIVKTEEHRPSLETSRTEHSVAA